MDVLTRKIGPLPGWAWGALAIGAGLAFFFLRGRGTPGVGTPAGSVTNNPAASSIPFVPSVTVTGIPPAQSSSPTTSSPGAVWQFGPPPAGAQTVWSATPTGQARFQQATGGPWPGGVRPGAPDPAVAASLGNFGWQWAIVPSGTDPGAYAQQLNQSGGSGGWGQAGTANAVAMMGWTSGWTPLGGRGDGPGSGGAPLRPQDLAAVRYTGTGPGGSGGSGASGAVNRTGTRLRGKVQRPPLRRRQLSGR